MPTITLVFLYFAQENQPILYELIRTLQARKTLPRYVLNPSNKGNFWKRPAQIYPRPHGTKFPSYYTNIQYFLSLIPKIPLQPKRLEEFQKKTLGTPRYRIGKRQNSPPIFYKYRILYSRRMISQQSEQTFHFNWIGGMQRKYLTSSLFYAHASHRRVKQYRFSVQTIIK